MKMTTTTTKESWENKKEERRTNVWKREGLVGERSKKYEREGGSWCGGKSLEKQKTKKERGNKRG